MRIGVDFRIAGRHQGGMAVYVKNLVETLQNIDSENSYILLDDRYLEGWGFWQKLSWIIGEQIWLQYKLVNVFKSNKLDMGFFPNPPVPFLLNVPIVLTIADLAFFHDLDMAWWIRTYLWIMYFLSAHKATGVVTFSLNSKRDIVRILKISPDKVHVIALAAAKTIRPITNKTEVASTRKKYGINKSFILAVPGTFLPRKNIADLLVAFAKLNEKNPNKYQLVTVGISSGDNFRKMQQLTEKLEIKQQTIFTGRINDEELSSLYSGASIFVCPSLYEGFGLPILEAMKCGTPVIAYNNSSLPEVVGKAGILVGNPQILDIILRKLLRDKDWQNRLRNAGWRQAKKYSWEISAKLHAKMIKEMGLFGQQ